MMKKITVFTPTFNRAYCLGQLYDSLIRQTNPNFIWMIIDDGSSDSTQELVQSWMDENKIEIRLRKTHLPLALRMFRLFR